MKNQVKKSVSASLIILLLAVMAPVKSSASAGYYQPDLITTNTGAGRYYAKTFLYGLNNAFPAIDGGGNIFCLNNQHNEYWYIGEGQSVLSVEVGLDNTAESLIIKVIDVASGKTVHEERTDDKSGTSFTIPVEPGIYKMVLHNTGSNTLGLHYYSVEID